MPEEVNKAVEEMRRLHGREAFAKASTRAATAHLDGDMQTFEFWRQVAVALKREGLGH
jgi:hypothetical protein